MSSAEDRPDRGPGEATGQAGAAGRTANSQVRAMCALLGLEAALMLGLAAGLTVALATSRRETDVGFTLAEIGLCVMAGAVLGLGARGLLRGQRWPRSAMLTLQLLGLPFGFRFLEFGEWVLGVPLLAILATTLVLLFLTVPPTSVDEGGDAGSAGPDPRPARGRRR